MVVFDSDYDALRDDASFQELLQTHGLNRRYEGVWQELKDRESRMIFDVGPTEHKRLAKELSAQHYALVCLDVQVDPSTGQQVLASVWQRHVAPVEDSIGVARRLARLATTAARLRQPDAWNDVVRDRYGREVRAQQIEIAPSWLTVEQLLDLLRAADSLPVQRSSLLALGSAASGELPAPLRSALAAQLQRLAETADDPSLAAAVQWCATKWKLAVDIPAPRSSSPAARTSRRHVNSLGQTMIVLEAPDRYLMGSPRWDVDRNASPGAEQLHWQRIGRRFAVAATETTVAMFKEYLDDPRVKRTYDGRTFQRAERYAPDADCPQTSVRWYDAVRFCQWLSEHEKIPEAQWCYPGVLETAPEKWQFPDDLLTRRGYRLPTEAEWEYACRGGSTAARYYGDDRRLLHRYAWHLHNADEQSHPVATLLPNDFGLFDMLGNVHEWCHDAWHIYKTPLTGYLIHDRTADPPPPSNAAQRILRGGSFETLTRQVRCADRSLAEPLKNSYLYGFRVARTELVQTE